MLGFTLTESQKNEIIYKTRRSGRVGYSERFQNDGLQKAAPANTRHSFLFEALPSNLEEWPSG